MNKKEDSQIAKFINPSAPTKNQDMRNRNMEVELITNLFKLEISESEQKLCVYSVSIIPELAKDNYPLYSKIQRQLDNELNKYFTKKSFSGNNLFASSNNPKDSIICEAMVEGNKYLVTFKRVSQMEIREITDFEGVNQRKKSFLEKVIKDILLRTKNTVKFGNDRTIVRMEERNVYQASPNESIYKGYYTSAQITENGLFLLVLNVNKHVSTITVYDKINSIRSSNRGLPESEIRKLIEDYFLTHKTVLTTYGALRTYRIKAIDFDINPRKTGFNIRDKEGRMKTITIEEYYRIQYNININYHDQPLIIAENKEKGKKHLLNRKGNGKEKGAEDLIENDDIKNEEETVIYLVPELLFITGTDIEADTKDKRRSIISKTKVDPNKKIEEIIKITQLMKNNKDPKRYKGKDGNFYPSRTSAEVARDWGINLGENLSIKGRILPQPKLLYGKGQVIYPKNGNFRSGPTFKGVILNKTNFTYVYDQRDNSNIRSSLISLLEKARYKGLKINNSPNEFHGIPINTYNNWEDIRKSLNELEQHANKLQMTVVFLSPHLEKHYSNLKEYFTNVVKIPTQFIVSKKLSDQRKVGSIMFNVVEQINIKMGGTNFYIDFYNENILTKGKLYLIIGLECRQSGINEMDYVMTSTTNMNLNKTITTIRKCKNNIEDKEKTIADLMQIAFKGLKEGRAPHPPNYIILYRQGGNYIQNKKIAENEIPLFTKFLNNMKNTIKQFKIIDPKFIYVCCNLKGDLKFFEKNNNNRNYMNPKSGLCVDSSVTRKDIYEFYIQPQYVNQGTATPCHYQVLYEDRDKKDPNNNLKLEQLQLLSFYLSYYYWTWGGAVRVPGALKLATAAMDFFSKHLNGRLMLPEQKFNYPYYI